MSISRLLARSFVFAFAICMLGFTASPADAQQAEGDTNAVSAETAADPFAVPEGSPAELLSFIEGLANRNPQASTREELRAFMDNISAAIGSAANGVLAAKATDKQTIDAIEWKVEALRIRGKLGDGNADKTIDEFLKSLASDSRPAVVEKAVKIRGFRKQMKFGQTWEAKLRFLRRLDAPQRAEVVAQLVKEIKADDVFANQLVILVQFCDTLADSDDSAPAVRAINELLPLFQASADPDVVKRLPLLKGIARRLNLPGNPLDISGTLLDGSEFDWAAYRGKVVLVDFWASWCGPCLAELPGMKENFRRYHAKGFDIVGISLDEDRNDTERVIREAGISWVSLFHVGSEEDGWQHPMALKYGVIGIPRAILVDQQGKVVHMNARGPMLGAELERLLGEPSVDASSAVESSDETRTALNKAQ